MLQLLSSKDQQGLKTLRITIAVSFRKQQWVGEMKNSSVLKNRWVVIIASNKIAVEIIMIAMIPLEILGLGHLIVMYNQEVNLWKIVTSNQHRMVWNFLISPLKQMKTTITIDCRPTSRNPKREWAQPYRRPWMNILRTTTIRLYKLLLKVTLSCMLVIQKEPPNLSQSLQIRTI